MSFAAVSTHKQGIRRTKAHVAALKSRYESMKQGAGRGRAVQELQASAAAGKKALQQLEAAEEAAASARAEMARAIRGMQDGFETAKAELQEDLMRRMRAVLDDS